jgi:hypothetical protein
MDYIQQENIEFSVCPINPSTEFVEIRYGRHINLHFIIHIFKYINKLQRMAFVILSIIRRSAHTSIPIIWMSCVIIGKEIY